MTPTSEEQRAAVNSEAATTIVVAGPGAGKTKVICERILHRIENENIDPAKIVVITYTNAGAKEITSRHATLQERLGYVGTLHGFCLRLLNQHGHNIGYRKGRSLTILTEEEREELLKQVKNRLGYDRVTAKAIEEGRSPAAQSILKEFRATMKRENVCDFDMILVEAEKLLNLKLDSFPAYSDLLVDEAQDSADIDWRLYWAIPAKNRFVVGDLDQSIFQFRGANPKRFVEHIAATADDPNGLVCYLEDNYRSDKKICEAANALIRHNTNRVPKVIAPISKEPGNVYVLDYESSKSEALGVANMIQANCWNQEIAVLAFSNEQVDTLRETLIEMEIPVADERVRLPQDWSFCLTTIQLMQDPQNNLLCQSYLRGIGRTQKDINAGMMLSMKLGQSLYSVMEVIVSHDPKLSTLPAELTRAGVGAESVELVTRRIDQMPPRSTVEDLMTDLWRAKDWLDHGKTTTGGVIVSTIHSMKGREADTVFVCGCEEGILPRLSKSADLEENRRLMFVAVTRARHRLFLTYCKNRFYFGQRKEMLPSRFLREMNP